MALDAGGEDGTGGRAAAGGEGQKQQSAADLPRGVLDDGQGTGLHLGPVVRDVVEILGVGGDLLEQAPGLFERGVVLLLLVLASAFGNQTVLAPDAVSGTGAGRQVELTP